MKESNIDVKALSSAYKEKKKMRDDSNVVKIGKMDNKYDPMSMHYFLLACACPVGTVVM